MERFLIEYNMKVIGTFDNYEEAEKFIYSCYQNKLVSSLIKILTFKCNSCFCCNENTIPNIFNKNNNEKNNIIELPKIIEIPKEMKEKNDKKMLEMGTKKIELQHQINLLKHHKKRIEESKTVYENDIKLYNKFDNNKNINSTFIIPELFVKKYEIIKKLKEEDKLSWDNFVKEFKTVNNYDDFGSNNYDDIFIVSEKSESENIDEEMDISDSNSEYLSSEENIDKN